ncbi:MAG: hypothetical protein ACRDTC_16910 [Pseudonocardiaceae bacterium]
MLASLLLAGLPSATPLARPSLENYSQYSMMMQRHTGQFFSDGRPAGRWSWETQGNESHVSWGDPLRWPTSKVERFIHADGWILLDGWWDNGTYYVQRVHRELIGDGSCQNLRPISSHGGRQHYVQWRITSRAYCLNAWGTVTEQSSGRTADFFHSQVWSPPDNCGNAYLGARTCIRQWESWWDNHGSPGAPITRKLERSVSLARGVGMAFSVNQSYPYQWSADLRWYQAS